MASKYQLWYTFCDTEAEAKQIIADYNRMATTYQRRKYKGRYMPYKFQDPRDEHINYIVWTSR